MNISGGLLPPEFLSIVKATAVMGFFAAGAMIIGLAYKGFKKVLGEEMAREYRFYFVLGTLPFIFILGYMFFVIF
ncbi:MAG: hypothetical protein UT61_C0004G0044 [Candidatus Woesebacteria bacterium GW2011_GWA1_39_8]|uniref:Uncharacterized protein n=1 Tax=Candidatus Woesebacteria bacterium GW2011_GWA1_39_8 TaxID=1618552 RepID=A0A0G0SYG5_9BACT|nr:MAG: hypothetical protein UT61_C0004G0044 [Candidatus Woesebacteria bacterium GW2011_GWA1_39_8]